MVKMYPRRENRRRDAAEVPPKQVATIGGASTVLAMLGMIGTGYFPFAGIGRATRQTKAGNSPADHAALEKASARRARKNQKRLAATCPS